MVCLQAGGQRFNSAILHHILLSTISQVSIQIFSVTSYSSFVASIFVIPVFSGILARHPDWFDFVEILLIAGIKKNFLTSVTYPLYW